MRFNLNRDARPLATSVLRTIDTSSFTFQSQPRCQAPGDSVSERQRRVDFASFNLNRDARPLATWHRHTRSIPGGSFNLNRDARPLATSAQPSGRCNHEKFQSQPRCQAPGDSRGSTASTLPSEFQSQPRCQAPGDGDHWSRLLTPSYVSISTEMPGPWRPSMLCIRAVVTIGFNLNRDARPLATQSLVIEYAEHL